MRIDGIWGVVGDGEAQRQLKRSMQPPPPTAAYETLIKAGWQGEQTPTERTPETSAR